MAETYGASAPPYTLSPVTSPIQVRGALVMGVLLGVTSGAIALGEAFVFPSPGGGGARASLYLLLGALLVSDLRVGTPRGEAVPLGGTQKSVGLGTLAVLVVSLVAALVLGDGGARPEPGPAAGAAAWGWAGAQVALLLDAWRDASGGAWLRPLVLAPALGAGAVFAGWPTLVDWGGPWPVVLGLGLGAVAALGSARLVRRHAGDVLSS
jgi:hypothetical protein